MEAVARARTEAASDTKTINKNLKEIDTNVTLQAVKKMTKEDQAMLRTIQCGGGVSKVELLEFGNGENTECDYCGHQWCNLDHILWECPHFNEVRRQEDEQIAKVNPSTFTRQSKEGWHQP